MVAKIPIRGNKILPLYINGFKGGERYFSSADRKHDIDAARNGLLALFGRLEFQFFDDT